MDHMPRQTRVLVTGAGDFIDHHLASYLKNRGYWMGGVDIKSPEFTPTNVKEVPEPQGVRGRNSDNIRPRQVLRCEPKISIEEGLARTYTWIEEQVMMKMTSDKIELPQPGLFTSH